MRHWSTRKIESKLCELPFNIQEYFSEQGWYWWLDENVCRRRGYKVSTSENVDIKFHITEWNAYYSSAVILFTIGSCLHKKTLLCWVHSKEMLQQFCAVSSGRKKAMWRKSKIKCRRRNNEASSQQLLRLSAYGPKPTHCNKLPQWRKNTCGL